MGLMSVALDLLLLIHPMSNAQDELKEVSSSRQDLKNDMQDLEAAGFLKPCKETPDSWDFAQVPFTLRSHCLALPSLPLPCLALPCLALPSLPFTPLHSPSLPLPCPLLPWRVPTAASLRLSLVCRYPAAVLRCALCTHLCNIALGSASRSTNVHGNVCFYWCFLRHIWHQRLVGCARVCWC